MFLRKVFIEERIKKLLGGDETIVVTQSHKASDMLGNFDEN
jgi:hypothetical protein